MMTDCPSSSLIFGWRMRKKISLLPPGAAGFTTRIGLTGNCCAPAVTASVQQRRKAEVGRRKGNFLSVLALSFLAFFFIPVSSLRLDAGIAHDLDPFRDLGLVESVVLLRRAGDDVGPLVGKIFLNPGIVERLDERGVNTVQDRARRASRREQ